MFRRSLVGGRARVEPKVLGQMDGCSTREERIAAAREAFVRVDKDGSGTIELDELEYLLNLAGVYPTAAEMDVLYTRFDLDRDGEISLPEFLEVRGRVSVASRRLCT